jgi:hypothetical protein
MIGIHVGKIHAYMLTREFYHIIMETLRYLEHIISVTYVEVLCRPYIFIKSHKHIMNLWNLLKASQSFSNILVLMILASTHLTYVIAHGFGKTL